ncbi:MAG: Flp pilus assembly protein CpaB [Dehalococcoidia bacterium]
MATSVAAPRHRSNRAILVLALMFGLITAVLAYVAVSSGSENSSATAETTPVLATESVVTTIVDIPSREIITADMVQLQQVPIEALQPGAFRTVEEVVGTVAIYPAVAGQQLLATNVSEFGAEAALSFIVPQGMRAIAVNATSVKAVGGYILPGDFVDIVGIFKWAANPDLNVTATLAQNSEVLAVERTTELIKYELDENGAPLDQSERENGVPLVGEENPDALYLVVAVTPAEAQRVFAADFGEDAEFRFLLRRTADHGIAFLPAFIPVFGHCGDTLDSTIYGDIPEGRAALSEEQLCELQQEANLAAAAASSEEGE